MNAPAPIRVNVEVEEEVYRYQPVDNEAPPLWCYGSTCLTRTGGEVFISGMESLPGVQKWNNVRWLLFRRERGAWALQMTDPGRTREPSPIAAFPDGRLFMSANPTLAPINAPGTARAQPQLLRFSAQDPKADPVALIPPWDQDLVFTQHSYRGLCADGRSRELLMMNIYNHLGEECYYWALMGSDERWIANGRLDFPFGHDYETPQIIRLCYPQILLRDRAVHVLAISDIVEPVKAWKEARFQVTGRSWDYDFRRLFYTHTPDITTTPFTPWIEVATREQTAGHISNLDLWVAGDGGVHLLWNERSCDTRIRERFFPDEELTVSLQRAVIRDGRVVLRRRLVRAGEAQGPDVPVWARFHIDSEERLFVYYAVGEDGLGAARSPVRITANRIVEVLSDGSHSAPAHVPLQQPFDRSFMTATPRGGAPLSQQLELYGTASEANVYRYARVRVG